MRWLQRHAATYDTALLYVSDHGESLGENNLYLHGLPYAWAPREQSPRADDRVVRRRRRRARRMPPLACLRQRRDEPLSHDNLFHTTLGQLGIATELYRKTLDAFASCRAG